MAYQNQKGNQQYYFTGSLSYSRQRLRKNYETAGTYPYTDISDQDEEEARVDERNLKGVFSPNSFEPSSTNDTDGLNDLYYKSSSVYSDSPSSFRRRALSPSMFARTNPAHLRDEDYRIANQISRPQEFLSHQNYQRNSGSSFFQPASPTALTDLDGSRASLMDYESAKETPAVSTILPLYTPYPVALLEFKFNDQPVERLQSLDQVKKKEKGKKIIEPEKSDLLIEPVKKDAKLAGYTGFATLLLFVCFHILPILEWFPMLMRNRMGPTISSITIILLSFSIGYHFASSRFYYYNSYLKISKSKSFPAYRSLFLLLSGFYLTSLSTNLIFYCLFLLYTRVPIIGTLIVMSFFAWSTMFMVAIACLKSGGLSYQLTVSFYDYVFGPVENSVSSLTTPRLGLHKI
jgi:hypothetical protein